MTSALEGRELTTLQAARGVAALAVVLSHAGTVLGAPDVLGHVPALGIFRFGHAGVDFFFVLSGFIIFYVHREHIGRPRFFLGYLWKRAIRIYPIYWVTLGLLTVLAMAGLSNGEMGLASLFVNLLLLPQHQSPWLGASWTLQHELLFYLIFGLAILNQRLGAIAVGIWLIMIMGTCFWAAPDPLPWAPASLLWGFIATSYHLQFLLGIAAAIVVLKNDVPVPRFFLALGIVGFACTAVLEDAGLIAYLGRASQSLYGGFAAVALVGMASAERIGLLRSGAGPVFTGTASYTIYLLHGPVIAAASWLLVAGGFLHAVPGWLLMVMLAATGTASGIVVHLAVERPIAKLLRRASVPSGRPREGSPSIDRPHRLAL